MSRKRTETPEHLQWTLATTVSKDSLAMGWREESDWFLRVMGALSLACVGSIPVLFGAGIVGALGGVLAAQAVLALGFVGAIVLGGKFIRSYRRSLVLAPESAASQTKAVRKNVELLRKKDRRHPASPEAQVISREGLRLAGQYDTLLQQWAQASWADPDSPDAARLGEAAAALAGAVATHVTTLQERLAWERSCRDAANAPYVPDVAALADAALAEARNATQSVSEEREKVQLQQQILSSLRSGETPGLSSSMLTS